MTDLEPEDFWLDKGERFAVDFDEAFAFLRMVSISFVSDLCRSCSYLAMCDCRGCDPLVEVM
jgi:hypothetical protein